jgi:hypothetical protein
MIASSRIVPVPTTTGVALGIRGARFYLGMSVYHITGTITSVKVYKGMRPDATKLIDEMEAAATIGTGNLSEVHLTEPAHADVDRAGHFSASDDENEALKSILDGTVALGAGGTTLTGTTTSFLTQLSKGCLVSINGVVRRITAITTNTAATVDSAFDAGAISGAKMYRDDSGICVVLAGGSGAYANVRWSDS